MTGAPGGMQGSSPWAPAPAASGMMPMMPGAGAGPGGMPGGMPGAGPGAFGGAPGGMPGMPGMPGAAPGGYPQPVTKTGVDPAQAGLKNMAPWVGCLGCRGLLRAGTLSQ